LKVQNPKNRESGWEAKVCKVIGGGDEDETDK